MDDPIRAYRDYADRVRDLPLVRCFSAARYRNVGDPGLVPPTRMPGGKWEVRPSVTVYNDKTGGWETYGLVDYVTLCPGGCGTRIRVQAVAGTTWLGVCSRTCMVAYVRRHPDRFTDGGRGLLARLPRTGP